MNKYLLGLKIRENRNKIGLSQQKSGLKINKTGGAIKAYENGIAEPSLNVLEDLAKIFNMTLIDLLDIDNSYLNNRMFEKYKKLNPVSKYMIDTLIDLEFLKETQAEYKTTETNSQLTSIQQEKLEELRQAKSLLSMEKKKIEKMSDKKR